MTILSFPLCLTKYNLADISSTKSLLQKQNKIGYIRECHERGKNAYNTWLSQLAKFLGYNLDIVMVLKYELDGKNKVAKLLL